MCVESRVAYFKQKFTEEVKPTKRLDFYRKRCHFSSIALCVLLSTTQLANFSILLKINRSDVMSGKSERAGTFSGNLFHPT